MSCRRSLSPASMYGGDHVFVPFAMEDGGTLGAHAHALLKTLAEHAVVLCWSPQLPRQSLSVVSSHAGVSLDAALAESPFHVVAC